MPRSAPRRRMDRPRVCLPGAIGWERDYAVSKVRNSDITQPWHSTPGPEQGMVYVRVSYVVLADIAREDDFVVRRANPHRPRFDIGWPGVALEALRRSERLDPEAASRAHPSGPCAGRSRMT